MTFYNIVSAFLFIGAFRQLILLLDSPLAWTAAIIAVIVVNDAVFTSQLLEASGAPPYRVGMKIIDVLCFGILSLALISLAPLNNPFQVQPPAWLVNWFRPWVTWCLLSIYWALLVAWNALAGVYKSTSLWAKPIKVMSVCAGLPFLVVTIGLTVCACPLG